MPNMYGSQYRSSFKGAVLAIYIYHIVFDLDTGERIERYNTRPTATCGSNGFQNPGICVQSEKFNIITTLFVYHNYYNNTT